MKYEGVVVFFKPEEKMFKNIDSYIEELDKLYIVDNTPDIDLSSKFKNNKKIKYIPLKENKGIAYALNVGAKEAIKDDANWLLTMDQDSKFDSKALKYMKDFIKKISNDNYLEELLNINKSSIGIISPFHETVRTIGEQRFGIESPITVMTSGNLVNLKAYQKIGGFKDWLFIDCVDFDFCLNMKKNGYSIIQLNEAKLHHELGDIKKIKFRGRDLYIDNHSAFRRYFISRNRLYLNDIYKNDFPDYCKLELKSTKKELVKIWMFEDNKIKKTIAIYRGYRDYKKGVVGDGRDKKSK